jgi:hypothetical protein
MYYNSFVWLPICAVLTAVGLVLSYYYGRRRGYLSMMRGAAWSLLPIAAYLTGSVKMFWKIGVAIGQFANVFVFSPEKWAGIGVAGLAAVLFFATGNKERRRSARLARKAARDERKRGAAGTAGADGLTGTTAAGALGTAGPTGTRALDTLTQPKTQAPVQANTVQANTVKAKAAKNGAKASSKSAAGSDDDDMKDIDEILRKRGL